MTWIWGKHDSPQNSDRRNQRSQPIPTQDDIIERPKSAPNLPLQMVRAPSLAQAPGPPCCSQLVPCPAVWDIAGSGTAVPGGRGHGMSNLQLTLGKGGWQPAQQLYAEFWPRKGWVGETAPRLDRDAQVAAGGDSQRQTSKAAREARPQAVTPAPREVSAASTAVVPTCGRPPAHAQRFRFTYFLMGPGRN